MKPVKRKKAAPRATTKPEPTKVLKLQKVSPKQVDGEIIYDEEFIKLADRFSKSYRHLGPGTFMSLKGNYQIDFLEKIYENNDPAAESTTDARVSHLTGRIEISQAKLIKRGYTDNYIFFLLLWCRAAYAKNIYDTLPADRIALYYYALTGRSMRDVFVGMFHTRLYGDAVLFQKSVEQIFEILSPKK